jgi:hypothetical protein
MKSDCPLLEHLHRPQMGGRYGCAAGINFYALGKDRARCRVCPLAAPGSVPDCQHLYANAWLLAHPDRTPFVEVELVCELSGDPVLDARQCAGCAERLPQLTGLFAPAMAPALAA